MTDLPQAGKVLLWFVVLGIGISVLVGIPLAVLGTIARLVAS